MALKVETRSKTFGKSVAFENGKAVVTHGKSRRVELVSKLTLVNTFTEMQEIVPPETDIHLVDSYMHCCPHCKALVPTANWDKHQEQEAQVLGDEYFEKRNPILNQNHLRSELAKEAELYFEKYDVELVHKTVEQMVRLVHHERSYSDPKHVRKLENHLNTVQSLQARLAGKNDVDVVGTSYYRINGKGRRWAEFPSLQNIPTWMRNKFSGEYYHDLDIVNCWMVISQQVAKKYGLKVQHLDKYVFDREVILKDCMEHYDCTRKAAKELFIRLLNGGGERQWRKDFEIPESGPGAMSSLEFILSFQDDCKRIQDLLITKFPHFVPDNKHFPSEQASVVLQCIEDQILRIIVKFVRSKGYEVGSLVFDGCMPERKNMEAFPVHLLREAENIVKVETGYDIQLLEKDMTEDVCPWNLEE